MSNLTVNELITYLKNESSSGRGNMICGIVKHTGRSHGDPGYNYISPIKHCYLDTVRTSTRINNERINTDITYLVISDEPKRN